MIWYLAWSNKKHVTSDFADFCYVEEYTYNKNLYKFYRAQLNTSGVMHFKNLSCTALML